MSRIYFSRHATMAVEERRVTEAEVIDVVHHPEVTYGSSPWYPEGTKVLQKGELAVVTRPDKYEPANVFVVTVLWRQPEQWNNVEMARARAAARP